MSAKHPTPWKVVADAIHPTTKATIFDDNGEPILPYVNGYGVLYPHTAEFIVEAVNERDRLRDLVRRLLPLAEIAEKYADADAEAIKGICALKGVDPSVVDAIRAANANLLREARDAIGEDEE